MGGITMVGTTITIGKNIGTTWGTTVVGILSIVSFWIKHPSSTYDHCDVFGVSKQLAWRERKKPECQTRYGSVNINKNSALFAVFSQKLYNSISSLRIQEKVGIHWVSFDAKFHEYYSSKCYATMILGCD